MSRPLANVAVLMLLAATAVQAQNKRDVQVRDDKQQLAEDDSWFYNDFPQALAAAKAEQKPMLVIFR